MVTSVRPSLVQATHRAVTPYGIDAYQAGCKRIFSTTQISLVPFFPSTAPRAATNQVALKRSHMFWYCTGQAPP
jgi:hypothetical protein